MKLPQHVRFRIHFAAQKQKMRTFRTAIQGISPFGSTDPLVLLRPLLSSLRVQDVNGAAWQSWETGTAVQPAQPVAARPWKKGAEREKQQTTRRNSQAGSSSRPPCCSAVERDSITQFLPLLF
jgi:hypothetical protein